MNNLTVDEIKKMLADRLKKERYEHSLGVADTAAFLAARFGEDENTAYLAGLLHDCAREYRNEDLLAEADKRGIAYGEIERRMPLLLHAPIGAWRMAELYGVNDRKIAQAIALHTVGGANMSRLDKIIWFADMIEPNRKYPEVEELRRYAREKTLDEMMLKGLDESIKFIVAKKGLLHPATVAARNELLL